jgi:hypothetical protein
MVLRIQLRGKNFVEVQNTVSQGDAYTLKATVIYCEAVKIVSVLLIISTTYLYSQFNMFTVCSAALSQCNVEKNAEVTGLLSTSYVTVAVCVILTCSLILFYHICVTFGRRSDTSADSTVKFTWINFERVTFNTWLADRVVAYLLLAEATPTGHVNTSRRRCSRARALRRTRAVRGAMGQQSNRLSSKLFMLITISSLTQTRALLEKSISCRFVALQSIVLTCRLFLRGPQGRKAAYRSDFEKSTKRSRPICLRVPSRIAAPNGVIMIHLDQHVKRTEKYDVVQRAK